MVGVMLARKGSKGVVGKNMRLLGGRPLVCWTLDVGVSKFGGDMYVSTDCEDVAWESEKAGASVLWRRDELCGDTALAQDVWQDVARTVEATVYTILQCTVPWRGENEVEDCIKKWDGGEVCCTVSKSPVVPNYNLLRGDGRLWEKPNQPMHRRQDCEECYVVTGSVLVIRRDALFMYPHYLGARDIRFVVTEPRVDIDTERDWGHAEYEHSRRR